MGNISSTEPMIELYKWSNAEFREEYALICTSLIDRSRSSVFRLSAKPEKVLCRLADSLCHEHPLRLHAEITAEKDHNGHFKYGAVRVVVDGIPAQYVSFRDDRYLTLFGGRSCDRGGVRNVEISSSTKKLTWEFFHSHHLSYRTRFTHSTHIHCDKAAGMDVAFGVPFRPEEVIYGEPPRAINAVVDREFQGKEYILFQEEGKVTSKSIESTHQHSTRVIVNNGGHFIGHGSGSTYNHCNIVMQ